MNDKRILKLLVGKPKKAGFLSPRYFDISIDRLKALPFTVTHAQLPGITLEDRLCMARHDNLCLTFKVDAEIENWSGISQWMQESSRAPKDTGGRKKDISNPWSDISVTVQDQHKQSILKIIYENCYPTELSGLDFQTQLDDEACVEATAVFVFRNFTIERP